MEVSYSMEGHGALPSSQESTLRLYERMRTPQCPLPPDHRLLPLGLGSPLTCTHALLCPHCGSRPSHMPPLALMPSTHLGQPMALLDGPCTAASVPHAPPDHTSPPHPPFPTLHH